MVKFKDFSRPLNVFPVLFKANLIFKQDNPVYSSPFQACANPVITARVTFTLFILCQNCFQKVSAEAKSQGLSNGCRDKCILIWINMRNFNTFWVEEMTYKAICIYFSYIIFGSLYRTRYYENAAGWQRLAGACIVHTILAIITTTIADYYCNVHVLYKLNTSKISFRKPSIFIR